MVPLIYYTDIQQDQQQKTSRLKEPMNINEKSEYVQRIPQLHNADQPTGREEEQHNILKAKSNFTLLLYIPFLGIGEWYFKCV